MKKDLRLIALAAAQHHLVARGDVAKNGLSSQQWCDRVDDGLWIPVSEAVFRHLATPSTSDLRARAAAPSLGRNAALYGPTAAQWFGLDTFMSDRLEFVVPRIRRSLDPNVELHTTKQWHASDLITRDGLRTTTATRTIIDLASSRHPADSIESAIDSAIRLGLTSLSRLTQRMSELASGRRGIQLLQEILLDSGGESFLERRFLRLIRSARLPRPACQLVHGASGRVMRVDFEFGDTNVVVEVSGRLGHTSDRDRQKDARRRNHLQQLDKTVLEFTTVDVLTSPDYVVATLHRSGVVTS